jgi:dihydrofolate reductase
MASFIFISLDGFYEGPNGELDWPNVDAEFNDFAVRQLDEADTLGFGRATYEHMAAYWPTEQAMVNDPAVTSRMNGMEKLVFSTTLTDASWSGTTVMRGEAVEHVRGAQGRPGQGGAHNRECASDRSPGAGRCPRRASNHDLPDRARPGPIPF